MPEPTEQEFKRHLNTKFQIAAEEHDPIELELVEVKSYQDNDPEKTGMERFSLFFVGPPTVQVPQHTYPLRHPQMGVCDIFLVPVGAEKDGFRYEAVFNYYKTQKE